MTQSYTDELLAENYEIIDISRAVQLFTGEIL